MRLIHLLDREVVVALVLGHLALLVEQPDRVVALLMDDVLGVDLGLFGLRLLLERVTPRVLALGVCLFVLGVGLRLLLERHLLLLAFEFGVLQRGLHRQLLVVVRRVLVASDRIARGADRRRLRNNDRHQNPPGSCGI